MDTRVEVEVACQICGSREAEEAYRRDIETAAHGRRILVLSACKGCGFIYANPRPSRTFVRARRDAGLRLGAAAREARLARCPEDFVRRAAARLEGSGRWLDVGRGHDILGITSLPGLKRIALEPVRAVAEAARRRGVDVIETNIEENPLAAASFDLITCSGLLEFSFDVRDVAFGLERLLRPGGLLVVHVLDVTRPIAGVPDFFARERLSHFSPGTLTRLLVDHGLRPLLIERSDAPGLLVCASKEERGGLGDVAIIDERAGLRDRLERYRREQAGLEAGVRKRFTRLAQRWKEEATRLAIYGAEEHAQFLLDLIDIRAHVDVVVDPDPARQGRRFLAWKVQEPRVLHERSVDAMIVAAAPPTLEARETLEELESSHGVELIRFLAPERAAA